MATHPKMREEGKRLRTFMETLLQCVLIGLFAMPAVSGSDSYSPPAATFTFDLKQHGLLVKRDIVDETSLGFLGNDKIGIQINQCPTPSKCGSKLLTVDLLHRAVNEVSTSLPGRIVFLSEGRMLFVHDGEVAIYKENFEILGRKKVPEVSSVNGIPNGVLVSPNGRRFSIPTNQGSSIVSAEDLELAIQTARPIFALGNQEWFEQRKPEFVLLKQNLKGLVTEGNLHIGTSYCPVLPTFLNDKLVFLSKCDGSNTVVDETGQQRYKLGKSLGDFSVAPNFAGTRFATELYVEKVGWSGTSQYSKRILRVFDSENGKVLFHLEDAPAENEPTARHYFALSAEGTRLATIRNGVLEVFDLPTPSTINSR